MTDGGALVLTGVAGKCTTQLLDLHDGRFVPGAKAFHGEGEKHNPLLVTGLPRFVYLALVCNGECVECLFESLNVCLNVYLKRALVWIMFKCVLDLSQSTWLSSSRFRPVTMISRDVYQLSGSWIQIQFVKH